MSHRANSNLVSLINAKGDQRTFTYDQYGQQLSVTQQGRVANSASSPTTPAVADTTVTFTYDNAGNLTSITNVFPRRVGMNRNHHQRRERLICVPHTRGMNRRMNQLSRAS